MWGPLLGLLLGALLTGQLRQVSGQCAAGEVRCSNNYRLDGSPGEACIPNSYVGDGIADCYDNSDENPRGFGVCATNNKEVSCFDGACQPLKWRNDGAGACSKDEDEIKRIGIECNSSDTTYACERWVENTICDGATLTCQCALGYIASSRTSCKQRTIGDSCTVNEDCSTFIMLGICDSTLSQCDCDTKYIGDVGTQDCRIRVLNDVCRTHANCAEAIVGATCSSAKRCVCRSGWRVNAFTGTTCEKRRVWDLCDTNPDCFNAISNSECYHGTCQCLAGYRNSPDRRACLALTFGKECETDRHCAFTADAVCSTSSTPTVCACADGYHLVLGASCIKGRLSDICTEDSECASILNSVCSPSSGRCVCAPWSHQVDSQCVIRIVGDSCDSTESLTCSGLGTGGVCDSSTGRCACKTLWYPSEPLKSYCYPRYLGSPCSLDEQCARTPQASCIDDICDCPWGRENNYKCSLMPPENATTITPTEGEVKERGVDLVAVIVPIVIVLLVVILIVALVVYFCKKKSKGSPDPEARYKREATRLSIQRRPSTRVAPAPITSSTPPVGHAHPATGSAHNARGSAHTARGSAHTARGHAHTARGHAHPEPDATSQFSSLSEQQPAEVKEPSTATPHEDTKMMLKVLHPPGGAPGPTAVDRTDTVSL